MSGWDWNRTNDLWFFRPALLPFGFLPPASCRLSYPTGFTSVERLELPTSAFAVQRSLPTELHGQQTAGAGLEPATSDLTGAGALPTELPCNLNQTIYRPGEPLNELPSHYWITSFLLTDAGYQSLDHLLSMLARPMGFGPGARTLKRHCSVVFRTTALPIRLALYSFVMNFHLLLLWYPAKARHFVIPPVVYK
jgi:hypothetical protein